MSITARRFFHPETPLASADVEDRFFTDLRTSNATFKRTGTDRFHDLDALCLRAFEEGQATIDEVLDIGISSGATSLALSDRLRDAGHSGKVTGTDICIDGCLVKAFPGVHVLTDDSGHPLQYDVMGQVVRPWGRRADYATGMLFVRALANAWIGGRARKVVQQRGADASPVQLISPRARTNPHVRIERNDIFVDTPAYHDRFDFVRAANILNRGYFDEAQLRRAISNIVQYMSGPNAYLLVVRSTQGQHVGTLFQVSPDGKYMNVVDRSCGGSEVEWLILEAELPGKWAK